MIKMYVLNSVDICKFEKVSGASKANAKLLLTIYKNIKIEINLDFANFILCPH